MESKSLTLSQLIFQVKKQLNSSFATPIWIVAEISELNINYSGHCYLELIEKEEDNDKMLAKSRATIWARSFRIIKPYFETTARETLKAGLKILIKVTVEFHEFYGFSLNVQDIDPSYTVGDLALKRTLIIEKLQSEGVFDMNRAFEIPTVPQRIAVITSETAAGYGDFKDQLLNNPHGYNYKIELFPAVMQGHNAPASIVDAFNLVFDKVDEYDVVVLIRGGGSKVDLSCFDDYDLAYFITQIPLPVITGIGHERDESVADMVANLSLKTPTAVANFLIDTIEAFDTRLYEAYNTVVSLTQSALSEKSNVIKEYSSQLYYQVKNTFDGQFIELDNKQNQISTGTNQLFRNRLQKVNNLATNLSIVSKGNVRQALAFCNLRNARLEKWINNNVSRQNTKLNYLASKLELIDPANILKRGFAIVSLNGKVVKNATQIKPNDIINVKLSKGTAEGKVTKTSN